MTFEGGRRDRVKQESTPRDFAVDNQTSNASEERFDRLKEKAQLLNQDGRLGGILADPEYINFRRDLEEAQAHFGFFEEQFRNLPETHELSMFEKGQDVLFPASETDPRPVTWKIVRAEKSHFLLERTDENKQNLFMHALCSQSELLEFNQENAR